MTDPTAAQLRAASDTLADPSLRVTKGPVLEARTGRNGDGTFVLKLLEREEDCRLTWCVYVFTDAGSTVGERRLREL